ncbi:hypothetical protein D3C85_379840 [compost metagenome]
MDFRWAIIDHGTDLTQHQHFVDVLFEPTPVEAVLQRNGHTDTSLFCRHLHHGVDGWLATLLHGRLAYSVNRLDAVVIGHHFKVVGVGERGFRTKTETTGDGAVFTFGRVTKNTVDRSNLFMGNPRTKVTNDDVFIGNGDLQRGIGTATGDVPVPTVADDFPNGGQLRVGVQGCGEDVHKCCTVAHTHLNRRLLAEHCVCDSIRHLADLHGDTP